MNPQRLAMLPDWPGRLSEAMAADYLSCSLTKFRDRVKAGIYPPPIRDGGNVYWARRRLDHFIDAQHGLPQPSAEGEGLAGWEDFT